MHIYPSRGGEKLAHALEHFHINIQNAVCADLGCSTGGFSACLLSHGAAKVFAVDTGYGVLDWSLRKDPRVIVMERQNALFVQLPEPMDCITIDVGWTRQKHILPHALSLLKPHSVIISLLKPHYEANKEELSHGKVKEPYLQEIVDRVLAQLTQLNIHITGYTQSPITGEKGRNIEYLLYIQT